MDNEGHSNDDPMIAIYSQMLHSLGAAGVAALAETLAKDAGVGPPPGPAELESWFSERTPDQIKSALLRLGREVPPAKIATEALIAELSVTRARQTTIGGIPDVELAMPVHPHVKEDLKQLSLWLSLLPRSSSSDLVASFERITQARSEPELMRALRGFKMALSLNAGSDRDFLEALRRVSGMIDLVAGKTEVSPAASELTEGTLRTSSIARVLWSKNDKVSKVELGDGGIAYVRKPFPGLFFGVDLRTGPNRDYAMWLLHQASGSTMVAPTALRADGTSITAEVDGFRDLLTMSASERADLDVNAVLLWIFVTHHLDANVSNIGADSTGRTVMVDGEAAFLPGFSERGVTVMKRVAFNLHSADGLDVSVDPALLERWRSWTLDDVRRILEPSGLSNAEIAGVHQRIRAVVEGTSGGRVSLAKCIRKIDEGGAS